MEEDLAAHNISFDPHEEAVSVSVSDNGDGTLSFDVVENIDGILITNVYTVILPLSGEDAGFKLVQIVGVLIMLGTTLRFRRKPKGGVRRGRNPQNRQSGASKACAECRKSYFVAVSLI